MASRSNATAASSTSGTLSWILSDRQDSASLAVEAATGTATRDRYLPYGGNRATTTGLGGWTMPNDRGWLGQVQDKELGLDYLQARYYDPVLAHFVSTDPFNVQDDPQSANPTGTPPVTPIKDIVVGDQVLATDAATGVSSPEPVTDLIRHFGPHTMVDVHLSDGSTIEATDHHPFYDLTTHAWTDAIDLKAGDKLRTSASTGQILVVTALTVHTEDLTAYNLTVNDLHTYYAGRSPVLVHNSGGACPVRVGQQGEKLAGIAKNTTSMSINGRDRIPDQLTRRLVGEVKNVKCQHLSRQLQDNIDYAAKTNRKAVLFGRKDVRISKPLQRMADQGKIRIVKNLPKRRR